MLPFFEPVHWFLVYNFGITLTLCVFLFLWMMKKLSSRFHYDDSLFRNNILWYFLSIFIFSRLFYVISKWNDLKYIRNPLEFFIMNDYNFSLFWCIIWFTIVFLLNLKFKKEKIEKYIDGLVISFLFILFIWFIGTLLGGQVYWRETHIWIEIAYTNPFTPVPFQVPIFPLPIIYSICFFIAFSCFYILSLFVKIRGLLGYAGMVTFWCIILIFEFFSGKQDFLKEFTFMNLNQFFSIIIISFAWYKLYKILTLEEENKNIIY